MVIQVKILTCSNSLAGLAFFASISWFPSRAARKFRLMRDAEFVASRQSAIYQQLRPAHARGTVGEEEQRGIGHLRWVEDASVWLPRFPGR
jgi:hypothetical protein